MSLRQIAQNLGLSVTTVSRALGGYSDVSDATRQRIESEAERIGYIPNEMARRLQKGRADAIGFVIPGGPEAFDDPYFLKIIRGASVRAGELGLDLLVMAAPEGAKELKIYRRLVEGRRVDGVIVTRLRPADPRLDYLQATGFPFVAVGSGLMADTQVAAIDIDCDAAMRAVVGRLVELGHSKIACAGPLDLTYSKLRIDRFRAMAEEFGFEAIELSGDASIEGGEEILRSLRRHHPDVTALVANADRIAAGAVRAMRPLGLLPGRDLSIISFGDSHLMALSDPPITAIRLPTEDLAVHAVDALMRLREGLPAGPQPDWPIALIARGTDGPVAKSP